MSHCDISQLVLVVEMPARAHPWQCCQRPSLQIQNRPHTLYKVLSGRLSAPPTPQFFGFPPLF